MGNTVPTPSLEALRQDIAECLNPRTAVERRIVEHILDGLTRDGLEALLDMTSRQESNAYARGKRDAEHDDFDDGYRAGQAHIAKIALESWIPSTLRDATALVEQMEQLAAGGHQ